MVVPSVTIMRYSHDLDLTFRKGLGRNVNLPIERPYMTFYIMAIVMFAIPVTICEIFTIKMRVTLS